MFLFFIMLPGIMSLFLLFALHDKTWVEKQVVHYLKGNSEEQNFLPIHLRYSGQTINK